MDANWVTETFLVHKKVLVRPAALLNLVSSTSSLFGSVNRKPKQLAAPSEECLE